MTEYIQLVTNNNLRGIMLSVSGLLTLCKDTERKVRYLL